MQHEAKALVNSKPGSLQYSLRNEIDADQPRGMPTAAAAARAQSSDTATSSLLPRATRDEV